MARRILVSGARGFIGTPLTFALRRRGDQVFALTRGQSGASAVHWNPARSELDASELEGFDAVIHLSGESIQGIWTKAKREKILASRRDGTRLLAAALAGLERKPECLISASAVGFYGNRGDALLTEQSGSGDGFMSEVVREWEAGTDAAGEAAIRVVNLRLGLVLAARGGALGPIRATTRLGAGGRLGSGRQWWSWVTLDDVVRAFIHAVDNPAMAGPFNVASPAPATNAEFTKVVASVMHRPALMAVPRFALRLAAGAMADELLLASQRLDPTKLLTTGFEFEDPELRPALERLLA
jgi:uncharacterized protein (TIGR01777 family)